MKTIHDRQKREACVQHDVGEVEVEVEVEMEVSQKEAESRFVDSRNYLSRSGTAVIPKSDRPKGVTGRGVTQAIFHAH